MRGAVLISGSSSKRVITNGFPAKLPDQGGMPVSTQREATGAASSTWRSSLDLLEEQQIRLEQLFKQQNTDINKLIVQHRAALSSHKQAISGEPLRASETSPLDQRLGKDSNDEASEFLQRGLTQAGRSGTLTDIRQVSGEEATSSDSGADTQEEGTATKEGCCARWMPGWCSPREGDWNKDLLWDDSLADDLRDFGAPPGSWQEKAIELINHEWWSVFVSVLIVLQTIVLAAIVNYNMQELLNQVEHNHSHQHPADKPYFSFLEKTNIALMLAWLAEVIVRLVAERQLFFPPGPHSAWNVAESILLVLSLVDLAATCWRVLELPEWLQWVRVLRVARLIRLVRIMRTFAALQQLRMMLFSFASCFEAFAWSLCLMMGFSMVFAIFLLDVGLMFLRDPELHRKYDEKKEIIDGISENWGGIWPAMKSLVFSLTGGDDYGNLMAPYAQINPLFGCIYVIFVLMVTFGLLNVLVGIFVKESEQVVEWDKSLVLKTAMEKREQESLILSQLFSQIDKKGKGYISLKEMQESLKLAPIRAWFQHLDIDMAHNAHTFFELLDDDKNGFVTKTEFATCCMRLKGGAKPLSLEKLVIEVLRLRNSIKDMEQDINALLSETKALGAPRQPVAAAGFGAAQRVTSTSSVQRMPSTSSVTRHPSSGQMLLTPQTPMVSFASQTAQGSYQSRQV